MKLEPQKLLSSLDFSISEKDAKKIAKKVFYQLNKSNRNSLGDEEVQDLLRATYQGLRVEDGVSVDDTMSYITFHGNTKSPGRITYQEFEDMVVRLLCLSEKEDISDLHLRRAENRNLKDALKAQLSNTIGEDMVEKELKSAQTLFQKYDINKNGYLEFFEIPQILIDTYAAMGKDYKPTDDDVSQYIEMMDLDKDGKISNTEYDIFVLRALESRGIKLRS